MSSDSTSSVPGTNVSPSLFLVNRFSKVSLKKEGSKILLILPKEENELKYLEKSIGKTGKRALLPVFRVETKDLWQIFLLR